MIPKYDGATQPETRLDDYLTVVMMRKPTSLKDIQWLAGSVAMLNQFIAQLGKKVMPFYQLMKKSDRFEWTKEAQTAFDGLKQLLSTSSILVAPKEGEPLYLYITAPNQVVSVGLWGRLR